MGTELFNVTDVLHDSFSEMENFYLFVLVTIHLTFFDTYNCVIYDHIWTIFIFLILIECVCTRASVCITFEKRTSRPIEHGFNLIMKILVEKLILEIKV